MTVGRRLVSRTSLVPAAAVLVAGLLLHAADQATAVRAGPIPILLTAPVVAALCYRYVTGASVVRLLGLVAWGVVGSGLGVLGVYLVAVSYQLPRVMTGTEMVLFDLGMFLWFVLVLGVAAVVAGRSTRRTAIAALLAAPVVQAAFVLGMVVLVELGVYA